jgi:pentatricopeptide repeat protein
MRDSGVKPNSVTYTSLIDACAKDGQVQLAGQTLREMVSAGFKPDPSWYTLLFDAGIRARQGKSTTIGNKNGDRM